MRITFRDLWPDAVAGFRMYLASALVLGGFATFLDAEQVGRISILACIAALVLPLHLGIFTIRKFTSGGGRPTIGVESSGEGEPKAGGKAKAAGA